MEHCIGIDVHRKFIQVCVMDREGSVQDEARLDLGWPQELAEFFRAFPPGTDVAMEATMCWGWLSDLLQGLDLKVHLAHMRAVKLIAESRKKTDKIDARVLADLLRTGFLPECYLPDPTVRRQRMVLRHRESMIKWRTSAKNAVHSLLMRHNIHLQASDIFGRKGIEQLRALQLQAPARGILDNLLSCIEFLTQRVKSVEAQLAGMLSPDGRVELLITLPGIGRLTAYFVLSEVGEIVRFCRPAKFVSYCGLCPSTRQSASTTRHGSIRGGGRKLLQWALIEAAHTAVRRDSYFAGIFHRVARKDKRKAYVAVARAMAKIIWHMLTESRGYMVRRKQSRVGSCSRMTVGA